MFVCVVCVFGVCVGLFVWYMHVCEFITPLRVVCMCVCVCALTCLCLHECACMCIWSPESNAECFLLSFSSFKKYSAGHWWCTPLVPALGAEAGGSL